MTRRPRTPGGLYAVLTIVLVVLVVAITLSARQAPPPTIAEFAPQAVEHISDANQDQAGRQGAAAGDPTPVAAQDADELAPGGAIDVPRVRRCVGDPPRQIEDPQSPPCVPYWTGDNGGSTYRGVTRDEIRVSTNNYDGAQPPGFMAALQAFFNKRFEFYGRKLNVFQASSGGNSPETQRAEAAARDEQDHVFATVGSSNGGYFFHRELARRRLISVDTDTTSFSEDEMQSLHPYVWMYQKATDRQMRVLGMWACRRLVGKPAAHAGEARFTSSPRRFGAVIEHMFAEDTISLEPLEQELARCGASLAAKVSFNDSDDPSPAGQNQIGTAFAPNAVVQMRSNDVSSVFCFCVHATWGVMARTATNQAYFPEWLIDSYHFLDSNALGTASQGPQEQLAHMFGLSFNPKQLTYEHAPYAWAVQEIDPSYRFVNNSVAALGAAFGYRELLALASGIQLAGPALTPRTFALGLQRARFPNPQSPLMAGAVSFAGDHTMTDDAAEIWWSPTAQSPYGETGAYCYVDGGARHAGADWPGEENFFRPPCDSGVAG